MSAQAPARKAQLGLQEELRRCRELNTDLLEALRYLLHVVDGTVMLLTGEASGLEHFIKDGYGEVDHGLIENARTVIAKAEGR